jgi:hypothetical protein
MCEECEGGHIGEKCRAVAPLIIIRGQAPENIEVYPPPDGDRSAALSGPRWVKDVYDICGLLILALSSCREARHIMKCCQKL